MIEERLIKIDDLQAFYECALRYALGRRTYITLVISEGIMNLPDGVINARSRQVMLRDLERYFEDRLDGRIKDDDYDYESWKDLYDYLLEEI
jgi:hypothetical protein